MTLGIVSRALNMTYGQNQSTEIYIEWLDLWDVATTMPLIFIPQTVIKLLQIHGRTCIKNTVIKL